MHFTLRYFHKKRLLYCKTPQILLLLSSIFRKNSAKARSAKATDIWSGTKNLSQIMRTNANYKFISSIQFVKAKQKNSGFQSINIWIKNSTSHFYEMLHIYTILLLNQCYVAKYFPVKQKSSRTDLQTFTCSFFCSL